MDEQAIIAECQAGRMERFGELYDGYIERIYAFVFARTRHRETAEDVTSTTWLKALDHLHSFHGGSFQAWLYQIARHTVIDYYRTNRATDNLDMRTDLAGPNRIERQVADRLALDKVQAWLDQLPDDRRELVQLRLWDQLPYREIATITGQSEASCKMAFSRTLREIRSQILVTLVAGLVLTYAYVTLYATGS